MSDYSEPEDSNSANILSDQEWDRYRILYKEAGKADKGTTPVSRLRLFCHVVLVASIVIIGYVTYCMIERMAFEH